MEENSHGLGIFESPGGQLKVPNKLFLLNTCPPPPQRKVQKIHQFSNQKMKGAYSKVKKRKRKKLADTQTKHSETSTKLQDQHKYLQICREINLMHLLTFFMFSLYITEIDKRKAGDMGKVNQGSDSKKGCSLKWGDYLMSEDFYFF